MKKLLLIVFIGLSCVKVYAADLPVARAKQIRTDITNFDGTLSSVDTTVQKALETIDDAITGAGSGDVTSAGDCTSGACLDGTSDGGTYIKFYDAQGATQLIGGNTLGGVVLTLPVATGTVFASGGTDFVNDTHIDIGTGASQFSASDLPNEDIGDITITGGVWAIDDDSHAHTTTTISGLVDADMANDALDPDKLIGDATDDDKVDSTIVKQNAGTDISADLEEEVTEGSLADSTVVSADIKNGEIVVSDTAITAGRSLTWSTNDMVADAELYTFFKGVTIETPTDADNFFMFEAPLAMTITRVTGIVESATSAVLTFQECDSVGDNCSTIESVTADVDGTISTSIDNGAIDAGDIIRIDVGTVTGTVGQAHATITGTLDD
jgi:hypothetical protein